MDPSSLLLPILAGILGTASGQLAVQIAKFLYHRKHNDAILVENQKHTALLRLLNRNMEGMEIFTSLSKLSKIEDPMLKGCDISGWQGEVNFDQLKDVVGFVVIRASLGTGLSDAQFRRNRDEARRVGLPRGFYHYSYPTFNSGIAEAEWFCQTLELPLQPGEFLVLDWDEDRYESSFGQSGEWCLSFLNRVLELTGVRPMLYTNLSGLRNPIHNWQPVIQGNYGLWLAHPNNSTDLTESAGGWPVVAMKQYGSMDIPGHSGVDADVFYGDLGQLQQYGYQPPVMPSDVIHEDIPVQGPPIPQEPVIVPVDVPVSVPVDIPVTVTPPDSSTTVDTSPLPPTNTTSVKSITFDLSAYGWVKGLKEFALSFLKTIVAAAVLFIGSKIDNYNLTAHVSANFAIYATTALAVIHAAISGISAWAKSVPVVETAS